MQNLKKIITSLSLALFLAVSLPSVALANESGTEPGDDVNVLLDLAVLRPIGFIGLVGGTVIYIVSIPFTLPTGNAKKSFRALVERPAAYTFTRELGGEN